MIETKQVVIKILQSIRDQAEEIEDYYKKKDYMSSRRFTSIIREIDAALCSVEKEIKREGV
ncbi:MAG: hypothetical protein A2163_00810 [Actinobacteria bacterium RBG_13_35_12]|nr:MAG: hypothetical protein A2163_00810 [Actinobacteria bacterium RBG_13_35_12]